MEGETCGGPWDISGRCDEALTCVKEPRMKFDFNQEGTCRNGRSTFIGRETKTGFGPITPGNVEKSSPCPTELTTCFMSPCAVTDCPAFPTATCKDDYCGGCNAKFSIGNREVTADECKNGLGFGTDFAGIRRSNVCVVNGQTYKQGSSFKDDCNTCRCGSRGRVACTKMFCRPRPLLKTKDVCIGKKGEEIAVGDNYYDGCNNCFCSKGGMLACTKRACLQKLPEVQGDKEGCMHKGKLYATGAEFKDDCNTCTCTNDLKVSCTEMRCPLRRPSPFPEVPQGDKGGCMHKGQLYATGSTFKDDCNTCSCSNDLKVSCTEMACRDNFSAGSFNFGNLFGNVLNRNQNCNHEGKSYAPGQRFRKECNMCTCFPGGRMGCTLRGCAATSFNGGLSNLNLCSYNNKIYRVGQEFRGRCNNTCKCNRAGRVNCGKCRRGNYNRPGTSQTRRQRNRNNRQQE